MQNNGLGKQIARWSALSALFLITLAPLIIANNFFFPFITGKTFFFRILVEILVCAWLVLALIDKEYRPRFSWIGVLMLVFIAWMFVADSFAINVAKAFWSNFERMEGWVLLIHLFGFFLAAGAVLRVEKKWRAWFLTSLGVSLLVSIYALFQLGGVLAIHQGATRIDATFGNSAYLAIYFLFNVCIASWLALTEKRAWLKWVLIALAVLEAILIFYTETRGTVLGLIGAISVAALLTAFTAGKRVRYIAGYVFAVVVLAVGGAYLARDTSFVQHNHVLHRITSITLAQGATRFTIWHMALEGVMARPIVGYGQEGFNYIFNKYYEPSLFQQEQWFDRAHNVFIDWLTTGGFPGFFLYISLFITAFVMLWRSSELSRPERIALTAALIGYAIHNSFVFDNLYSYVYFFAILALIDSQVSRPIAKIEAIPTISANDGLLYGIPIATVVAIALIWTLNVPGMRVASGLITALSSSSPTESLATFKELAQHPSFAAQEVREQIVSFATNLAQDPNVPTNIKDQALTLAITQMGKQVASYPLDARERLELSYAYRAAGDYKDALSQVKTALTLSPKKETIFLEAGTLEWALGDAKAAQTYFNDAYKLGPSFKSLAAYAAAGDIAVGEITKGKQLLKDTFGTTVVDSNALAAAYYRAKDWTDLIALWKLRAQAPNASIQTWFSLAAAYDAAGQKQNAINTIKTVVAAHPQAAASGQAAIKQIEGK